MRRRTGVVRNIRKDGYGYEAIVHAGGRRVSKRFGLEIPIEVMQHWQVETRAKIRKELGIGVPAEKYPKSPDGWCWVYFITDGTAIKIGRATDPLKRLGDLQVSHHYRLVLMTAVPGHAILEGAIHQHFQHLHLKGEWFAHHPDLQAFIVELKLGTNPIALLWGDSPIKPTEAREDDEGNVSWREVS